MYEAEWGAEAHCITRQAVLQICTALSLLVCLVCGNLVDQHPNCAPVESPRPKLAMVWCCAQANQHCWTVFAWLSCCCTAKHRASCPSTSAADTARKGRHGVMLCQLSLRLCIRSLLQYKQPDCEDAVVGCCAQANQGCWTVFAWLSCCCTAKHRASCPSTSAADTARKGRHGVMLCQLSLRQSCRGVPTDITPVSLPQASP
jgi:hypothetical protein